MGGSSVIAYTLLAREVNYHLVSSFVFLLWDIVVNSKSEIKHIWSKPWNSFFKWLYLYLRYISLATQIFHLFAVPHLNNGKASRSNCFAWYIYVTILSQFHTTALEIILAARVYALFNRSRRIAMILGLPMTLEYIMLVIVIGKYFPRIAFIPYCILVELPHLLLYQTVVMLATQTTLIGLTLKHTLARRTRWGRTPLVSLLIRDGAATYFIECVTFVVVALSCKLRDERSIIIFFWLISIISSCGCRLIVNMQRLAVDENTNSVPCSHITSQIEVELSSLITLQSI